MPRREVEVDYEKVFQATTTPCAIFSADLRILDVNPAYLAASGASREAIVGRAVFEAFPTDPDNAEADFAENLRQSVEQAIATRRPDAMPVYRYAIPTEAGLEERFWNVVNIPVVGADGEIAVLLHRVEDVTGFFGDRRPDRGDPLVAGDGRAGEPAADAGLLTHAHSLREANHRLGEAKRRLERGVEEQALVAGLGQHAITAADEPDLFEQVLATVRGLPEVDFCEVLERRGNDLLVPRARVGWPAEDGGPTDVEARTGTFAHFSLEAPDPVVVDDVSDDDRFTAPERLVRHDVTSAATVRIGDPAEPLGILAAYSRARAAFSAADGHFLLAVANVVAAGLERSRRDAEVRRVALHDHLTGLPSRKLLMDRLDRQLAGARRSGEGGALALIDIDDFKSVNDTLGHEAGDAALRGIADRVSATLREGDTVARLGGDEFVLLLPGVKTREEAAVVVVKALEAIRAPLEIGGRRVQLDASLGVALFPEHGTDGTVLLKRADVAMYAAKRAGAGHAIYEAAHDAHDDQRFREIGDLRRAIAAGEITVHYQPKFDLVTGRVCSLEVLARWTHPERGAIPPDRFIGLAEEAGLIREVTAQVLDTALAQARRWRDEDIVVPVCVNLSAACVHDSTLIDMVMGSLADAGVPSSALELEITETAVMVSPGASINVLGELAEAGVRSSLDDFGTGYSSLAYLKRLPVQELKLDRAFVQDLFGSERDASIINAVIAMAHGLGLVVVGEGIETAAICRALRELGCQRGQGFHLLRPLAAGEMTAWLRENGAARSARAT